MDIADLFIGLALYGIVALLVASVLPCFWLGRTATSRRTRPVVWAVCAATVLLCVLSMETNPTWTQGQLLWTNQYELMADALLHGQLNLDLPVSPELAEMDNPYDYRRRQLLGVECYWDHAYYNGHYYMYFGVVPAVLLFAPFKLLTGMDLPAYHATQIFVALYVAGQFSLFGLLQRRFFRSMRLNAFLSLSVGFALMSTWFACAHPTLYCTAITSALACEVWSVYLFVRALTRSRTARSRAIMLAGGALLGALAFGCRPPVALANVVVVAVFIALVRRRGPGRELALDAVALAVPYVVVGCLLMAYNYARFDNPFEFGQSYQLTFYDQSDYGMRTVDAPAVLNGVLLFLFKPPFARGAFGGVFTNFPIIVVSLLALASPKVRAALRKNGMVPFLVCAGAAVVMVALIESLWSPAILERYRMDVYWLCGIVAFTLFGLWGRRAKRKGLFNCLVSVGGIVTALTAVAFFFVPHDYSITATMPDLLPRLISVLTFGIA